MADQRPATGVVTKVGEAGPACTQHRARVPVAALLRCQPGEAVVTPTFDVGGFSWRLYLSPFTDGTASPTGGGSTVYVAVLLQYVSRSGAPAFAQWSLSVLNRDPASSVVRPFYKTFDTTGECFGKNKFAELRDVADARLGYLDASDMRLGPCLVLDALVRVVPPNPDGTYPVDQLPAALGPPHRFVVPQVAAAAAAAAMAAGGHRASSGIGPGATPGGSSIAASGVRAGVAAMPALRGSRSASAAAGAHHPHNAAHSHQHPSLGAVAPGGHPTGPKPLLLQNAPGHPGAGHADAAVGATGGGLAARAALLYPYDDTLCDLTFAMPGDVGVRAHRCVIAARAASLLARHEPVAAGAVIPVDAAPEVLQALLRFLYTEQLPEPASLPPEALVELYALAARHGHPGLAAGALRLAVPALQGGSVLRVVLSCTAAAGQLGAHQETGPAARASRLPADDETLTNLFLGALARSYERVIDDPAFEQLPGHLARRLCRVMARREPLAPLPEAPTECPSLAADLAMLATSADARRYADYEFQVYPDGIPSAGEERTDAGEYYGGGGSRFHAPSAYRSGAGGGGGPAAVLPVHKFILASRGVAFSDAFVRKARAAPDLGATGPNAGAAGAVRGFTLPVWERFLGALYRNSPGPLGDLSVEDVALQWRATDAFGLDGFLRRATEPFVVANGGAHALHLLVLAEKHGVEPLRDAALRCLAGRRLADRLRADPAAWPLIEGMQQAAVVRLLRAVVDHS